MTSQRHLKYFQVLLKAKTFAQWLGCTCLARTVVLPIILRRPNWKPVYVRPFLVYGETFPCRRNLNTFIRLEFSAPSWR